MHSCELPKCPHTLDLWTSVPTTSALSIRQVFSKFTCSLCHFAVLHECLGTLGGPYAMLGPCHDKKWGGAKAVHPLACYSETHRKVIWLLPHCTGLWELFKDDSVIVSSSYFYSFHAMLYVISLGICSFPRFCLQKWTQVPSSLEFPKPICSLWGGIQIQSNFKTQVLPPIWDLVTFNWVP